MSSDVHRRLSVGASTECPQDAASATPVLFGAVRATTFVGTLQLGVLIVVLLRSKVLAVLLQPDGVGIVSTLDQLVQFVAQVSALSLILTPTRFLARASNQGLDAVTSMYEVLLKMLLLSTVGGTAIAAVLLLVEPRALGPGLSSYASVAVIAVITAPLLALSGFYANMAAVMKGYSRTSAYLLLTAAGSLIAAYVGVEAGGIAGLYYGNLIVGVVSVTALAVYLHLSVPLKLRGRGLGLRDAVRQHPDILAYCGTTYVLSFAQPLAFLLVRSVVLQRLGSEQAGYFQAAFMVSSMASLTLTQAIRIYLEPTVNRVSAGRSRIDAANEFQRTFAVLVLLGTVPLVLFPSEIIALLFTRAFTPISSLVFVLVVADCVLLFSQVYATVLMASDDFRGFFHVHVAGYLCLCVCTWILAPRFGLAGVAWSFVASRVLVFVLIQGALVGRHQLWMSKSAGAILAYALGVPFILALFFGNAPVLTMVGAGSRLAALLLVCFGLLIFLTPSERSWLRTLIRGARATP